MLRGPSVVLLGVAVAASVTGAADGAARTRRARAEVFSVTLHASDQGGKPLTNACFHWTFVQTGPSGQQDYDLCTNAEGTITVNYGTGFASITLTISQTSAPAGCSGGLTSPQTLDLTAGGPRDVSVQFGCPAVGTSVNAQPVSGTVSVRLPGTNTFVPLDELQGIPVGSELDTTKGTVSLQSATGVGHATQTLLAYSGRFVVTQARKKRAVTQLRLTGGTFTGCTGALFGISGRTRVVRRLWTKGKGRFRTKGRYSSGSVRGTFWLTADRCDGTLTRVRQGVVAVDDFVRHTSVVVRAGHTYLARAR